MNRPCKPAPEDPAEGESFRLPSAHAEHVVRLARQLADGKRPGMLATVDSAGTPHMRWMQTLSLDQFPHLYALCSPSSRKVAQIRAQPRVSWIFTSETGNMVVHISGRAAILTEPAEVNRIWRLIEQKENAYFLDLKAGAEGVAVIDTLVDEIDCAVPKYGLHYPARREG
ncbi:MAG TPA: pyridoxamine 5'-phosphate oxidase family protein [Candidatus Methylacidiphilales bacterium]|jgi:general stress protein 26|nr:pyridoxamine 5'-phosphate oxidase family protein [Candidatus Methylacidiphilales bacterium]